MRVHEWMHFYVSLVVVMGGYIVDAPLPLPLFLLWTVYCYIYYHTVCDRCRFLLIPVCVIIGSY